MSAPDQPSSPSTARHATRATHATHATDTNAVSTALARLQSALDAMHLPARAEERGALAIVAPVGQHHEPLDGQTAVQPEGSGGPDESRARALAPAPMLALTAELRRAVVQAAHAAGFSHVAVEVPLPPLPPTADASLPGRHPA